MFIDKSLKFSKSSKNFESFLATLWLQKWYKGQGSNYKFSKF